MKVMLIDDHAVVREGYRRLLELEAGCEVVAEFARADEALQWLARGNAEGLDVLVLDLSMPGMSGLDVLRHITQRWSSLKVLIFSMHDHPSMVSQALKFGACGYITKSSSPEELVQAARRVCTGAVAVLSQDIAGLLGRSASAPHESLSSREFQVLMRLLAGDDLEAIADRLHLSAKTVSNYQTLIRQKLGVGTAVELLRYAQAHGLKPV